ncbi:MAG: sigma 54-interacting transcriptional regulator [Planctomycetota bacterium]
MSTTPPAEHTPRKAPARVIIRENGTERIVEITTPEVHIGRSKENQIEIDDISSSRRHCKISQSAAAFMIEDLQSRNGTLVNGILIRKQELHDGDCIEIGKTRLFFGRVPTLELTRTETATDTLLLSTEFFMEPLTEVSESSQVELLQREREIFLRLLRITKRLCQMRQLPELLDTILDTVLEITGAERGFIILNDGGELKTKTSRNIDKEAVKKAELKVSHSLSRQVLATGRSILTGDARADSQTKDYKSVVDLKLESVMCVPLQIRGQNVGVIYVDNRFEAEAFQRSQLRFVEFLADQAGIFIENARLFEEAHLKQEDLRKAKEEAEYLNRQFQELLLARDLQLKEVTDLVTRRPERSFKYDYSHIVTKSGKMHQLFEILDRVIDTDIPVLIQGESGTGKELIAQAIHTQGKRAKAPFVSQNCAAIPPNLLESEFFGHVKGSFTGAVANKKGLFEIAHGGTLFLDEIGDMSLDLQTKLLRVLEDGQIRPVGGREHIKVDVRILSATNRPLQEMIRRSEFREDLYYRLNVINITLPPLRDRREDIPLLTEFFIERACERAGRERPKMDANTLYLLYNYDWPGNIRELENEVSRLCALADGVINRDLLSLSVLAGRGGSGALRAEGTLKERVTDAKEELERNLIEKSLSDSDWNKSRTARLLGVSRPTLDQKIEKYGIQRPEKKKNG